MLTVALAETWLGRPMRAGPMARSAASGQLALSLLDGSGLSRPGPGFESPSQLG